MMGDSVLVLKKHLLKNQVIESHGACNFPSHGVEKNCVCGERENNKVKGPNLNKLVNMGQGSMGVLGVTLATFL